LHRTIDYKAIPHVFGVPLLVPRRKLIYAAIRAGAIGATVITLQDGVLCIPTVYRDLASEHPDVAAQIRTSYPLADGDVLMLVSARDKWTAYASALAIAMTL
jgi:hypothetical protein